MAEHVCPWWVGYLLASPLRRLWQKPEELLGPHIEPGMTTLDLGCAMGFFSLPMAGMVGPEGRVICVDLQERMIRSLKKRVARKGFEDRVETRVCTRESLGIDDIEGRVDFAVAIAVVHETPDPSRFMEQVFVSLARGAKLLLSEPKDHVDAKSFERTVDCAREAGFTVVERPEIKRSRSVLLRR